MNRRTLLGLLALCAVLPAVARPAFAQRLVRMQAEGLPRLTGVTPDHRYLVANDVHEVLVYDLATDRLVARHDCGRHVFEPHGLSGQGEWIVGEAYQFRHFPRDPPDRRSVYYCSIDDWIAGRHREVTRTVDLTPVLPLAAAPRSDPHFARYTRAVLDVDEKRFAVLFLVNHRPTSRQAKVTTHLAVISRSDGRLLAGSHLASRRVHLGRREGDWVSAIEVLKEIHPPRREIPRGQPVPRFHHTTNVRRIRFPLDEGREVDLEKVQPFPGRWWPFPATGNTSSRSAHTWPRRCS